MPRPDNVGVGVAALVFDKLGRVLLLKRKGAHAAGCWSVPGGWVEATDASTAETVRREVQEETGLSVVSCIEFGWVTEFHEDIQVRSVTLYHLVEVEDGHCPRIMEPEKADEMGWHSVGNLPSPLFPGLENKIHQGRCHLNSETLQHWMRSDPGLRPPK